MAPPPQHAPPYASGAHQHHAYSQANSLAHPTLPPLLGSPRASTHTAPSPAGSASYALDSPQQAQGQQGASRHRSSVDGSAASASASGSYHAGAHPHSHAAHPFAQGQQLPPIMPAPMSSGGGTPAGGAIGSGAGGSGSASASGGSPASFPPPPSKAYGSPSASAHAYGHPPAHHAHWSSLPPPPPPAPAAPQPSASASASSSAYGSPFAQPHADARGASSPHAHAHYHAQYVPPAPHQHPHQHPHAPSHPLQHHHLHQQQPYPPPPPPFTGAGAGSRSGSFSDPRAGAGPSGSQGQPSRLAPRSSSASSAAAGADDGRPGGAGAPATAASSSGGAGASASGSGSGTEPKLTPSCARCRAKKLKCDQQVPCSNCISKKLEHECHKEERAPRQTKKRKLPGSGADAPESGADASVDASLADAAQGSGSEAGGAGAGAAGAGTGTGEQLAQLKRRVVELERLLARTGAPAHALPQPSRQHKLEGTAKFLEEYISRDALSFTPIAVVRAADEPLAAAGAGEGGKAESKPQTPSVLAAAGSASKPSSAAPSPATMARGDSSASHAHAQGQRQQQGGGETTVVAFMNEFGGAKLKERPNAYWQKHENREARHELVERVRRSIADLEPEVRADLLRYCWPVRAMGIFNRCIFTPEVVDNLERFIARTHQYADGHSDMNELALFCSALAIAVQFYPGVGTVRRTLEATLRHWNKGEMSMWRGLAAECLQLEKNMAIDSLEGLHAVILLSGQGLDDPQYMAFYDDILRRGVVTMELHKMGSLSMLGYEPGTTVQACRRKEMAVRTFWHVVCRDWSMGQVTRTYTFHPDQITTRPPLNLKDIDMQAVPFGPSRPFNEWTESTLFLAKIHLSHIVRGSIDMLNEQAQKGGSNRVWNHDNRAILDEQYQFFLKQLPSFFQLDQPFEGPAESLKGAAEIQRWLLHQLVFSQLLKLHRNDLGKKRVQTSCIGLAYVILEIHDKVRKRCRIIDSLAMNQDHIYGACIVLLLDLYAEHRAETQRATGLDRMMIRSKIKRAAGWLDKSQPRTAKAARLLQRLLDEEERHVQQHGESGVVGYSHLLEVAADLNSEEQARERGEDVEELQRLRAQRERELEAQSQQHQHQQQQQQDAQRDMSTDSYSASPSGGSVPRSTSVPSDAPSTPIDTALYPTLAWPYDLQTAPMLTSASAVQPVLHFPGASAQGGAADPLLSLAGATGADGASGVAAPAPMWGAAAPFNNGSDDAAAAAKIPVVMDVNDPAQALNDDLLWQMLFSGTTQVGNLARA